MDESFERDEQEEEIIDQSSTEETSSIINSLTYGSTSFPSQQTMERSMAPQQQQTSFSYPPPARDYQSYTAYQPPIFPNSSYGHPSVSPLNTYSQPSHSYSFDGTYTSPPLSSSSSSGISVAAPMNTSTPSFNFHSRPQSNMPPPPMTSTKRKSFDTDDGSGFGGLGIETEDLESVEGDHDYFGSAFAGGDGDDGEEGGERKKGRSVSSGSATGAQSPTASRSLDPVARQARIQAEQRRRNDLQESFRKLKDVLPPGNDKASKKIILERAVTTINNLTQHNRALTERLERYEGPAAFSSSTGGSSSSSRTHQPIPPRPQISAPHHPLPNAFPPSSPSAPPASHAPPLFPPPPPPSSLIDPSAPPMPQFAFDDHRQAPQPRRDS
ncbi:hypothetical protein BDY24DRAFT_375881 [Mrakia frigida]|uniref:uncharacterized protein n=1 Tax=Mrakia frigida TaxID=29902 RepID=UPI003FCBFA9C